MSEQWSRRVRFKLTNTWRGVLAIFETIRRSLFHHVIDLCGPFDDSTLDGSNQAQLHFAIFVFVANFLRNCHTFVHSNRHGQNSLTANLSLNLIDRALQAVDVLLDIDGHHLWPTSMVFTVRQQGHKHFVNYCRQLVNGAGRQITIDHTLWAVLKRDGVAILLDKVHAFSFELCVW
jgi:hypothetical protein